MVRCRYLYRAVLRSGGDVLIPGFVVNGPDPRRLLIRAIGPTLAHYGVHGSVPNPQLDVLSGSGGVITGNDDWWTANAAEVAASGVLAGGSPLDEGSRDAACVHPVAPGVYCVQVSGAGDAIGVALVEIVELP